jgi:hypothetical protein
MHPDSNGHVRRHRDVEGDAPTIRLRRSEVASALASAAAEASGRMAHPGSEQRPARPSGANDLALACIAAVLMLVAVLVDGVSPVLRLLLALPMIAVVPGYALMAATCPSLSVAGTVVTIAFARASASIHTNPGFTTVWMVPVAEAAPSSVRVGVTCQEEAATRYALQLEVDGVRLATWQAIDLAPGESWETIAALPAATGAQMVAEARLYRVDGRTVSDAELSDPSTAYRRVVLRP